MLITAGSTDFALLPLRLVKVGGAHTAFDRIEVSYTEPLDSYSMNAPGQIIPNDDSPANPGST